MRNPVLLIGVALCLTLGNFSGCATFFDTQRDKTLLSEKSKSQRQGPSEQPRTAKAEEGVRPAGFVGPVAVVPQRKIHSNLLDEAKTKPLPVTPRPLIPAKLTPAEEVPPPQGEPLPFYPSTRPPGATLPAQSPPEWEQQRISFHVDDVNVRKALEMLSRQANMSILVAPGVSGQVTLDLREKTGEEVLRAIAKLCRLSVHREGDVVYVFNPAETGQDELPVRVYHLNYVRSSDIETMIKPLLSSRGVISSSPDSAVGIKTDATEAGGNAMAGGEILIVQDQENVLQAIDRVIAQLDVQPPQVLIEAVIVSVKLEKGMELGVNFALLDGAGKVLGAVGDGSAINAAAGFTPAGVVTSAGKLAGASTSGFAEAANGLKFGFVGGSTTAFLRALESLGETKVLACPRLLVLNKQRAEIQLGDRLGYKTISQTSTSTTEKVEFMDVGTLLRLRPFISSDGMIRMEIHPERSSGKLDVKGVPQTTSAQVTTNVLVPDGTTIVIAGLMDHEIKTEYEGLPFLSRLPWIGPFFRQTIADRSKKELVVILTPHIWRPEAPCRLNYLGPPRALGLEGRVETAPRGTGKDPPPLNESLPSQPLLPATPESVEMEEPAPLEQIPIAPLPPK